MLVFVALLLVLLGLFPSVRAPDLLITGRRTAAGGLPSKPSVVCVVGVDANVSPARRRVIIMLKYPRPGAVKTRLVPALGGHRACALHRALVAHTIAEAEKFSAYHDASLMVEARVADAPDESAARAWLDHQCRFASKATATSATAWCTRSARRLPRAQSPWS